MIQIETVDKNASAEMGHNSSVAGGQLRAFVERIERTEEEIKGLNEDKRDIYSEAKSNGLDPKIIKKVVAIRRQDPDKRREEEEIVGLYLSSLGME